MVSKKKISLYAVIFCAWLIFIASGERQYILHIASMLLVTIGSCAIADFDIYHPMCWYPPFFALYSCSYTIFYMTGYVTKYGYSKWNIGYSLIALTVILLILPTKKIQLTPNGKDNNKVNVNLSAVEIALNCLLLLTLAAIIYILSKGFISKSDILQNGGAFINITFKAVYMILMLFAYCMIIKLKNNLKISFIWLIKTVIPVILFSLVTGERNYMFQIILIGFVCLSLFGKIRKSFFLLLIPIGVVIFPLTHIFKLYLLTGNKFGQFSMENLLYQFLNGEFISASRNLQILIQNGLKDYFKGFALLNDFASCFVDMEFSNQRWFNGTFFPGSATQYGFTLVGEGFMNGGIIGIIIVFAIVGILMRLLYVNANKNAYFMVAYIYMIPIFIYVTRADIGNLISPMIKYAFFGSFIIYILQKIRITVAGKKLTKV